MKPFNLEQALAGAPVITRDGTKVIRLFTVPEANPEHRLVAVFDDGRVDTLYENGKYYEAQDYHNDLFMVPTKKEGYINICKDEHTEHIAVNSTFVYRTKEEAEAVSGWSGYIATIKIEWEE